MTINQSSIQSERGQVDQSSYRECHTKINSLKNQVRKGLIPKATYEEEALNVMRVERTNGKVTLYHATPIKTTFKNRRKNIENNLRREIS